jgi:hypothetical protein
MPQQPTSIVANQMYAQVAATAVCVAILSKHQWRILS